MPNRTKNFNIEVGSGVISIFTKMETKTVQLFAEFIDNSLQSFLDHKEELQNSLGQRDCTVEITWTNDEIVIKDNAYGMNEDDFARSLRLHAPKKEYAKDSLSRYGMGLKYAAANLGSYYTIETTAYGSTDLFVGKIDVDVLDKENPKELQCDILETDKKSHYTIIRIKRLVRKFSIKEQDKLIDSLGKVYESFFHDGDLILTLNTNVVKFTEPEYRRNDKDGTEYLSFFTNSFVLDNTIYEYTGHIGILKKGGYDISGLQLKQNNRRVLELNYKPTALFGKGGTYRNLRVYGSVTFLGDNWPLRFDKDGLAWDGTGVEECFIESLKKDKKIKDIFTLAGKLRDSDNPYGKVVVRATDSHQNGIKSTYNIGETAMFTVIPNEGKMIKEVKVNGEQLHPVEGHKNSYNFNVTDQKMLLVINAIDDPNYKPKEPSSTSSTKDEVVPVIVPTKVEINPDHVTHDMTLKEKIELRFSNLTNVDYPLSCTKEGKIDETGYLVKFKNRTFSFDVQFIDDEQSLDFIEIKEKPGFIDTYFIILNTHVHVYKDFIIVGELRELFIIQGISFALARNFATHDGISLTESQLLTDKLNKILR